MYRKLMRTSSNEKGFLIPLAAIIVVGVGVIALTISKISSETFNAAVAEGISVQAFYAAESGAQYGMNQIFFDTTTRAAATANCTGVSGATLNFSVTGLALCSTSITCSSSTDVGDTITFYIVRSAATCGSGEIQSERTIEVSAFMQ